MKPNSASTETIRCLGIPLAAYEGKGRSRVVAFFTDSRGQVRAGFRVSSSTKKTVASQIPLFSTLDLLLSLPRRSSDLYQLREFDPIQRRSRLNQGTPILSWAAASVLSELVLKTTEMEESHPFVFRMLDKAFDCIEQGIPPNEILLAFWVKYLEHAGFGIRIDQDREGGEIPPDLPVILDVASGLVYPASHNLREDSEGWNLGRGRIFKVPPHVRGWFRKIRLAVFEQLNETHIPAEDRRLLMEILSTCIEFHLDVRLKSLAFWKEVMEREEKNHRESI
ncbi:MAG: DNA repair protein RecO [Candidatus Hinthialibacteria bacterium OLB16]|nr:MAG: DNA repair protein RecO [Candidatus Hinthialibacteria bacterium OLB16]